MTSHKEMLKGPVIGSGLTRRQIIAGSVLAVGGLAGATLEAQPAMTEKPARDNGIAIHQEVDFKAAPSRIYEVLLDGKQFSAFSGMGAEIDRTAGGKFTLFNGHIIGRNLELVPNHRIVQAWRVVDWDEGIYSIARFELKSHGTGALLVFDHTGFPEGKKDHLADGWKQNYWEKLQKYFG